MARKRNRKSDRFDRILKRVLLNPNDPAANAVLRSVALVNGLDRRTRRYRNSGWVYAARNPKFVDSVLKIGQTKVSPLDRVNQLSSATEHYKPFELVYFIHAADRIEAEKMIHDLLQEHRVNPRKEFFKVNVLKAARIMEQVAAHVLSLIGPLALPPRRVDCPGCSRKRDIPSLLISVKLRCRWCKHEFELVPELPSDGIGGMPGP